MHYRASSFGQDCKIRSVDFCKEVKRVGLKLQQVQTRLAKWQESKFLDLSLLQTLCLCLLQLNKKDWAIGLWQLKLTKQVEGLVVCQQFRIGGQKALSLSCLRSPPAPDAE